MADTEIDRLEAKTFEDDDSGEIPPGDIVAYNELRSCADLERMYREKILEIQPIFQRNVVWQNTGRTRFIDSLIKQLPIPSMCFSLDYKTQKWQVIDGLQRISTIVAFLGDENWTLSKLEDVNPQISGQPVRDFRNPASELNKLYTRVQNLTLPVTVLRCDLSKKSHSNYLFTIFHRLNTGGMKLNNQEIRNCIYSGTFNALLKKLSADRRWKLLNKGRGARQDRMQLEEVALRFFAFNSNFESYAGRLAKFLNEFMADNRNPAPNLIQNFSQNFESTLSIVFDRVFSSAPPPKLSVSMLESVMVGVSRNLNALAATHGPLTARFDDLQARPALSTAALREGIAETGRVKARLEAAIAAFG